MKKYTSIALVISGLLILTSIMVLHEISHEDVLTETGKRYHPYLIGMYGMFAGYAMILAILIGRHTRLRRRKESELHMLSSIAEHATDIIYVTDNRGVIEYVNPGFEQATGYSRREAIGKTPRLVKSGKHSEDFYRGLWSNVLRGREFRELFINRRKDGSLYYEEKTITPILGKDKKVTVGSTDRCNTIYSNLNLEGGGYGTNGTTRAFCLPESGTVATMEIRTVFERHRPCTRQARCVSALRDFVKWRDRASSTSSFSSGTHTG